MTPKPLKKLISENDKAIGVVTDKVYLILFPKVRTSEKLRVARLISNN